VVAAKLHIEFNDRQCHTWAELVAAIQECRRVLAQVDYKSLGGERCQAGGDFGHAMVLYNFGSSTGSLRAADPLCTESKVYPSSVIRTAMTVFAKQTGVTTGLRWASSRKVPEIE
jgi:hypothetical protein